MRGRASTGSGLSRVAAIIAVLLACALAAFLLFEVTTFQEKLRALLARAHQSDDVIAALSHMADFFVISRLSTMAFRRAPLGVRRIGELLGVQYVVSGSVQANYPRALVIAELVDTRDGRIVWSERFQGELGDVFSMQGELARKVVHSVAPFVRSLELQRARITNFEQLDAYAITLRGVAKVQSPNRRSTLTFDSQLRVNSHVEKSLDVLRRLKKSAPNAA